MHHNSCRAALRTSPLAALLLQVTQRQPIAPRPVTVTLTLQLAIHARERVYTVLGVYTPLETIHGSPVLCRFAELFFLGG